MMKTNLKGIKEIQKHYEFYKDQIKWGMLDEREKEIIETELSLKEKSLVELQNCRDFAVVYLTTIITEENKRDIWDMISAITFVIDCEKVSKGGIV